MGERLSVAFLLLLAAQSVTSQCGAGLVDVRILFGVDEEHAEVVDGEIGIPLVLNCSTVTDMAGIVFDSYEWRQNGEVVQSEAQTMLRIDELRSHNGGEYTCTANSSSINCNMTSRITVVTTEPDIVLDLSFLHLTEGDELVLTCNATGWPEPTIQWSRTPPLGRVIPPGPVYNDSEIAINEVDGYTCTANNSRGSITTTVNVFVRPTEPPTEPSLPTSQVITSTADEDGGTGRLPEVPFIVSIAAICALGFAISAFILIAAGIYCWLTLWRGNSPSGGEEVVMEELESQQVGQEVVMPQPKKKRNRAHRL